MDKPIAKKITSINNPLEAITSTLGLMKDQLLGKDVSGRDTAMADQIGDITIDTCIPTDTGIWETGIFRDSDERKWIIVSQYESAEEAKKEHKKWVNLMKKEPICELKDIDNWNLNEEE